MIRLITEDNRALFEEIYGRDLLEQAEDIELQDTEAQHYSAMYEQEEQIVTGMVEQTDALLFLICGFGSGRYIKEVLQTKNEKAKILVYEPDKTVFYYACVNRDLSDLVFHDDIMVVVGKEELRMALEELIDYSNVDNIRALVLPAYSERYKADFSELISEARTVAGGIQISRNIWKSLGRTSCENELTALSLAKENHFFEELVRAIPDKELPVIIVGAGPSLRKNMSQLRNAVGSALIVAVAHAVKVLDEAGIPVDLVIQMDQKLGESHLDHDKERKHRLLLSAHAGADIQNTYNGKIIYYGFSKEVFSEPGMNETEQKSDLHGGSVATDAYELFAAAGIKTIILTGQDLAYDAQGNSHTGVQTASGNGEDTVYRTAGINGDPVDTRGDWMHFLDFYRRRIPEHPETKVIDSTEGGALIQGTIVMPLEESIRQFCKRKYPVTDLLNGIFNAPPVLDSRRVREMIERHRDDLKQTAEDLLDAITLQKRILMAMKKKVYGKEYDRYCREYDTLYHKITEGEASALLCYYAQDDVAEYLEAASPKNDLPDQALQSEQELFSGLLKKAEELKEHLEQIANC